MFPALIAVGIESVFFEKHEEKPFGERARSQRHLITYAQQFRPRPSDSLRNQKERRKIKKTKNTKKTSDWK